MWTQENPEYYKDGKRRRREQAVERNARLRLAAKVLIEASSIIKRGLSVENAPARCWKQLKKPSSLPRSAIIYLASTGCPTWGGLGVGNRLPVRLVRLYDAKFR